MSKKIKHNLIKIFYLLFGITFGYIFVQTFIQKISMNYELNKGIYFLLGVVIFIIWYIIYKLIHKNYDKLSKKKELILLFSTFVLFMIIFLVIIITLKMPPQWDYGVVYEQAKSYVLTGDRTAISGSSLYLQYHDNNIGLFAFWVGIFKFVNFFGVEDFLTVATLVNAFMVGFSILLIYLCLRKLLDKKKAYFGLIISLFFVPLFTYIPIFYTDTLSMPFIMLILYLYLSLDKEKTLTKKNTMFFILILLLAYLGSKIKGTTWVIFIAIFIHFMFTRNWKSTLAVFIAILLFIPSASLIWQKSIIENKNFSIVENDYGSIPWTHYLMMGVQKKDEHINEIRCIGGYNYKDVETTLFFKTSAESKKYNLEEYVRRVKEYGFIGYLDYLTRKAVNAWGEGSFFTNYVYQFDYKAPNTFKKEIRGINTNELLYFEQGVMEAMLFIFSSYGLVMFCKKKKISYKTIIPLSIYGMFIVLLFWENRSRYLVNYIPLFIMLITLFYSQITNDNKRILPNFKKLTFRKNQGK